MLIINNDFGANKTSIRKEHMEDLILKIFILVLIVDSIESKAKNLMSERIFIRIIISQIIMMSILIKIKLNRERHYKYRN